MKSDKPKKKKEPVQNQAVNVDNDTKELLHDFVAEAIDSLDKNEPLIETIAEADNGENVNSIFRVFHTIKGLSGFFGMQNISVFTHTAETLLDIFRKNIKPQSQANLDLIYVSFDFLRTLLNSVSNSFTDCGHEVEMNSIIQKLKDKILELDPARAKEEEEDEAAEQQTKEKQTVIRPSDEDSEENFVGKFLSEALELITKAEKNLLELEKNPENESLVSDTFGYIHSLKGNAGFLGLKDIESSSMQIESLLDDIRKKNIPADSMIISFLLEQIDGIKNKLNDKESIISRSAKSVAEIIEMTDNAETEEEEIVETIPEDTPQPEILLDRIPQEAKQPAAATIQKKDIRVDTAKLDKLFDLVGELITIETMVINNPDLEDLELPNFTKSVNMLSKITRELQEITMSIRMTPLEGLFNKMKRLVRDLSIKFDKKIDLEISGQDTEMDKNVIEEISDPLVHILRNAIDHGIESAETRKKRNKNEAGKIRLHAGYEGNEIIIMIEDDGAGLNKDKILKKAIDRGLVKSAPEKLTDREIWQFIFEPGFSTAEVVTEVSGRGVGMDVVRRNLEKLRARIDIHSELGAGTKLSLRIPLTLAIMETMVISVGTGKFALPIIAMRESFRPKKEDITVTMDGLEMVKVRNELFPVVRLHEIFEQEPLNKDLEKGILINIESRGRRVCILVDDILGQQQTVIKGLSDYIGKIKGVTGCMIMGDGEIGLIVDIDTLIDISETSSK